MTTRVLFVCLGNICRSPAAEGVFRQIAPDMQSDSAGTSNWHVGQPPYAPMQAAMRARGMDISDLRARQIDVTDFRAFDMIIAMDEENRHHIESIRPDGVATPVRLMTDFATGDHSGHVPDPYYTREFDAALDLIIDAAEGLRKKLDQPNQELS